MERRKKKFSTHLF